MRNYFDLSADDRFEDYIDRLDSEDGKGREEFCYPGLERKPKKLVEKVEPESDFDPFLLLLEGLDEDIRKMFLG